jgi:hypothetical protein
MSEKRGYPNPDYTEEDVLEVKADLRIDDNEYRELCYKAAALDILAARIKATGKIEEEVVYACTGTNDTDQENDARQYERWYHDESSKNFRLVRENEELKEQVVKLQEQINQLLPTVDDEPEKEEQDE